MIGYSRKLAPVTQAPPEYNDPTGLDALCVPGFFFPCPDAMALSKSSLHNASVEHTVAPSIEFRPDENSAAISFIVLTTPTANAVCYFRINKNNWMTYDTTRQPYLTGPGEYLVECFAQAQGCYPSTVNMESVVLPAEHAAPAVEVVETPVIEEPTEKSRPKQSAASGLFFGSDSSSED